MQEEIKLKYGMVSSPVKVGNTVHRSSGPWTPTIHALLRFLNENGFSYSPQVLGIDEQGREILTYLPGEGAVRPWPEHLKGTESLVQVAKLLRSYHDLVMSFTTPANAEWRVGRHVPKEGQIIRHGDLGPWNTLWQGDQLTGLIDWDFAQPGDRIEDLAQMAYYFVPLRGELGWAQAGFAKRPDLGQRLQVLVENYDMFSTKEVVEALLVLLKNDRELVEKFGNEAVEPWASFLKRGDVEESLKDSDWLQQAQLKLLA